MATGPVALDQPPQQPPQVTGQMPNPAISRIAQAIMAARQAQGGQPGAPGASPAAPGAPGPADFQAKSDLIEQTLNDMARLKPAFATWGARALSIVRAGVAESMQAPGPGEAPPAPSEAAGGSAMSPGSAAPPAGELSKGFSG